MPEKVTKSYRDIEKEEHLQFGLTNFAEFIFYLN